MSCCLIFHERKGEARHSGTLFNQTTFDRVKTKKWPAVSRYLDELLIQKCQFRGHFEVSSLSLEKLSPKGSCHLDESSMNHTLAQKHLCEFWCGMHLTCKNTPIKPDRSHWMIRSEKPQVEVWLALDKAVKQQQKTQYDVSPSCDLNAPRCDTAGTEVCVQTSIQTSIQLISIASLAWLGNQPSHPLQLKRRLDKRLVKYSKLVHCNGKEPDKKKQFRQSR